MIEFFKQFHFVGDLSPWLGLCLALLFAAVTWYVYWRETHVRRDRWRWVLPLTRTIVVFFVILMLTEPVRRYTREVGQLSRIVVFVDASQSMARTDQDLSPGRKLLVAQELGWLPQGTLDASWHDAAQRLGDAGAMAGPTSLDRRLAADSDAVRKTARQFAEMVDQAIAKVNAAPSAALPIAPTVRPRGSIVCEYWDSVPGSAVTDLTNNPKYKEAPTRTATIRALDAPRNTGENYGCRMRGFLFPPASGNYEFFIASDDQSEIWLSPDEDPGRVQLIARCTQATGGVWSEVTPNRSQPVALEAGKAYFVEVLHKEGGGDDYIMVGWRRPDGKDDRPIPGEYLAPYQTPVSSGGASGGTSGGDLKRLVVDALRNELVTPARAIADAPAGDADQAAKHRAALLALAPGAMRWRQQLDESFDAYAQGVMSAGGAAIDSAIQQFDQSSRWRRAESTLLEGDDGLLTSLKQKHHVELWSVSGKSAKEAAQLWTAHEKVALPARLEPDAPAGPESDLVDGVLARVGDETNRERLAVVVLTDGQHNSGGSPIQMSRVFGTRQVPIYTVGLGDPTPPHDLAVRAVDVPTSVYADDRVDATIVLNDTMPAGRPFLVKIEADGKVLWEKRLVTANVGQREVKVDFPIKDMVDEFVKQHGEDVEVLSLPVSMQVSVDPLVGESEKENNTREMRTRAVRQKRSVLILDGRPRWETRYIRNLLERDKQWNITELMGVSEDGVNFNWRRDGKDAYFPQTQQELNSYDLVVFGEVPRHYLTVEQDQWIEEFVGRRGGGIWFIDGRRGKLRDYADLPVGKMMPVEWTGSKDGLQPASLRLTQRGATLGELKLARSSEDTENLNLWDKLPTPHRVELVEALPGTETLLEAVRNEQVVPALVLRRYGAGRVLYAGFDESWRWRYEVADKFHEPFWKQLAKWLMETPFAVRDDHVSLGTEKVTYVAGEPVGIRARLRDKNGKPVSDATASAVLIKDGEEVAVVPLDIDAKAGGLMLGQTDKLAPGAYTVKLRVTGWDDADLKAGAEFAVLDHDSGELSELNCNEPLLRQMAEESGGRYVREEDVKHLIAELGPMSQGTIEDHEITLSRSWWWFLPLVALLGVEWLIRKRAGLI